MTASSAAAYTGQDRLGAAIVARPAPDRSAARAVSRAAPVVSAPPSDQRMPARVLVAGWGWAVRGCFRPERGRIPKGLNTGRSAVWDADVGRNDLPTEKASWGE